MLGLALGCSSVISPIMTVLIITPIFFAILFRQPLFGILIVALMLPIDIFVSRGSGNSLVQYVGFVTFLAALLKIFVDKKNIRFPVPAIIFVGIAWLTSILNGFLSPKLVTYLMLLCLYWLIENYVTSAGDIEKVIIALIVGALASIPLGFIFGIGKASVISGYEVVRFAGGIKDPNDYAGLMVVCFGAFIGLMANKRNTLSKLMTPFLLVLAGVLLVAILMTYSRGGIIALVIVILVWLWSIGLKLRVILLTSLMSGIALRFVALLPGLNERLASILTPSGGENRLDIWLRAVTRIIPQHPWLGVGVGQFTEALKAYAPMGRIRVSHNMFLSVAVESGVIALVFFMLAVLCPFIALLFRLKTIVRQQPDNNVAIPVLIGTTGALVSGMFLTWDYQKVLWLMIALCHQVCWLYPHQQKAQEEQ